MTSTQFTHSGQLFACTIEPDEDCGAPWEEEDGHGVVSDWTPASEDGSHNAGHHLLCTSGPSYRQCARYYDWAASLEIAKRDSWGIAPDKLPGLGERLGRVPTDADITEEAVRLDYERLRAWCNDEWSYVGVTVAMTCPCCGAATGRSETLWGIESDSGKAYLDEVARELAEQLIAAAAEARTEAETH